MPELTVNFEDSYYQMLQALKPIAEGLIEDEMDFGVYVNMVLWRGIIEDIMPSDSQSLRESILKMYESNPEFVATFIKGVLSADVSLERARERLGFIRN